MNECTYKRFDELPLMLNAVQVAAVLGISRAGGYVSPQRGLLHIEKRQLHHNIKEQAVTVDRYQRSSK